MDMALSRASELTSAIADRDLRARLLLRIATYADACKALDIARTTIALAVADSETETRLGVVARRYAVHLGLKVDGFNPWAPTGTPEDPLIALPWVQQAVISATAAIQKKRLERHYASMWNAAFHIGRTDFDELMAAGFQAWWCGALHLRNRVQILLSAEILQNSDPTSTTIRWALLAQAVDPETKGLTNVVRAHERDLGPNGSSHLLREARVNPEISDDATLELAAGVWDVLDDGTFRDIYDWVLTAGTERGAFSRANLVTVLLWREPGLWLAKFETGGDDIRTALLAPLRPQAIDLLPTKAYAPIQKYLALHTDADRVAASFVAALRFASTRTMVSDPGWLLPDQALDLLEWNRTSVTQEVIEVLIEILVKAAEDRLREAADGNFALATWDTGLLLGRTASYLSDRVPRVVEVLMRTVQSAASPASWQFGALEGLAALRREKLLHDADITQLRSLVIVPGRKLLGEELSATVLKAAQLRVAVRELSPDDLAWLVVCARDHDRRARVVAVNALGFVPPTASTPAADWALVGALFDPDDEVVTHAVASVARRGMSPTSGAIPVTRERLFALGAQAPGSVRREVVVAAARRPELELGPVIEDARGDSAWTVRREANEALSRP